MIKTAFKTLFYLVMAVLLVMSLAFSLSQPQNLILTALFTGMLIANLLGNMQPPIFGNIFKYIVIGVLAVISLIYILTPKDMEICSGAVNEKICQNCQCVGVSGYDLQPYCFGRKINCD
jgi:hypothetical protein